MQNKPSTDIYLPGDCNIGPVEIQRRRNIGYLGLSWMVICILLLELLKADLAYKLLLFGPSVVAFSGFFQARQKFCFLYGFRGVSSMLGRRKFSTVVDQSALRKDKIRALKLVLQVVLASALVTTIYYFL